MARRSHAGKYRADTGWADSGGRGDERVGRERGESPGVGEGEGAPDASEEDAAEDGEAGADAAVVRPDAARVPEGRARVPRSIRKTKEARALGKMIDAVAAELGQQRAASSFFDAARKGRGDAPPPSRSRASRSSSRTSSEFPTLVENVPLTADLLRLPIWLAALDVTVSQTTID